MTFSFRTKLLASHVGLVIAVGIVAILSLDRWLTTDLVRQLDQRLEEQARGAAEWAEEGGRRHPDKVATRIARIVDAEVTLYDRNGTVIGASSKEGRDDRGVELDRAREVGVGRTTRARGDEEFHYVAVLGEGGIMVRLAASLADVNATAAAMRRRLSVASSVAIVVALLLGFFAARFAARPLAAMTATATKLAGGDFRVPIDRESSDEFGILWNALDSLARQLEARIGDLVSERDRLSAILAGMVEGVLVLDHRGRIVEANPAAPTILGRSGDVVGIPFEDVVSDEGARAHIAASLRRAPVATNAPKARSMDSVHGEATLEFIDERGATMAVYVRPLAAKADGSVVVVLRDMTDLRRLTTVRRDFVANVSHELRTPVTAIQGYAETLLRGGADAETSRQFLEILYRQAQRIGLLVEQLLALSAIEARDRTEVVFEPVSMLDVANHVAETARGRAEEKNVDVEIDVPPEAVALGDPEGVERALQNLVDNAIEYGSVGGSVIVRAVRKPTTIELSVTDDGPGIESRHLSRLFERFYRVDPGRARKHGGTGLGLAIVKHLAESMAGTVEVTSEVGRGTCFVVRLPAYDRAAT